MPADRSQVEFGLEEFVFAEESGCIFVSWFVGQEVGLSEQKSLHLYGVVVFEEYFGRCCACQVLHGVGVDRVAEGACDECEEYLFPIVVEFVEELFHPFVAVFEAFSDESVEPGVAGYAVDVAELLCAAYG